MMLKPFLFFSVPDFHVQPRKWKEQKIVSLPVPLSETFLIGDVRLNVGFYAYNACALLLSNNSSYQLILTALILSSEDVLNFRK